MSPWEPGQLRDFRAELKRNQVAAILSDPADFPPVAEPAHVLIRTDAASVDAAICRALALAVEGIEAQIELMT